MRQRLLSATLLLTFGLAAGPAVASNPWYVVGAVSQSQVHLDRKPLDAGLVLAGAAGTASHASGSHAQWRLQLGYRFNRYLALEGGYIDLGKARYQATFTGGSARASWKSGGVDLAVVGSIPLTRRLSAFAKAGAVEARTRTRWTYLGITGPNPSKATHTGASPFLGLGLDYRLNRRWTLRAEYERFQGVGNRALTGRAHADTFSVGAAWHF